MKRVVNAGPYFKKGEQGLYFEFGPAWHVWATELIDAVDALTGHRFCNRKLIHGVLEYMSRRTTKFSVALPADTVREFYETAGWHYPEWHDEG